MTFFVVVNGQWHWKDQLFHTKDPVACAYLNNNLENLENRKGNVSVLTVGKRIKRKISFRKLFRPLAYKYKKLSTWLKRNINTSWNLLRVVRLIHNLENKIGKKISSTLETKVTMHHSARRRISKFVWQCMQQFQLGKGSMNLGLNYTICQMYRNRP